MNEERIIEKVLRRYAKKRQRDAGVPLQMHPVMRRRLQDEVARRYGEANRQPLESSTGAWWQLLRRWARPLAWASPVLVAAGVILWALQRDTQTPVATAPASAHQEARAPQMLAVQDRKNGDLAGRFSRRIGSEPRPPVETRAPSADTLASAEKSSPAAVVIESFKALEKPPAVAPSVDEHGIEPVARSLWEVAPRPGDRISSTTETPSAPGQAAPPQQPESLAMPMRGRSRGLTNVLSQAFVNATPMGASNFPALAGIEERPKNSSNSAVAVAAQVLTRFQLVQAGNRMSVVDADGSIYVAEVADPSATRLPAVGGRAPASGASGRPDSGTKADHAQKSPAGFAGRVLDPAPMENPANAIRAFGTNRTLNQPVEFVWNFVLLTNGGPVPGGLSASAIATAEAGSVQLPLPQGVGIVGRARIGNMQEIEVRAVPENSQ